jgi:hypothetical protein
MAEAFFVHLAKGETGKAYEDLFAGQRSDSGAVNRRERHAQDAA